MVKHPAPLDARRVFPCMERDSMGHSVSDPVLGWSPATTRAMLDGDIRGTGISILEDPLMRGVRILPVGLNKHPLVTQWQQDATSDPVEWYEMLDVNPDAGIAIIGGDRLVIIDDDSGGAVEVEPLGIAGDTWAERTEQGIHYVCGVPDSRQVWRKAKLPGGQGDVIGGDSGYVVISPTRPRYPLHPGAPIRLLDAESALWELIGEREVTITLRLGITTPRDIRRANGVLKALLTGPRGHDIALLKEGRWNEVRKAHGRQRYPSQSEADLALMAMAVYGSGANPHVMDYVMRRTGLYRAKWDKKHYADGSTYGEGTIATAIATSDWARAVATLAVRAGIDSPLCILAEAVSGSPKEETVFKGTFFEHRPVKRMRQSERQNTIIKLILNECSPRDENGFVRLPVYDLGVLLGVTRRTISRDLSDLSKRHIIQPSSKGSDARKETWARHLENLAINSTLVRLVPRIQRDLRIVTTVALAETRAA